MKIEKLYPEGQERWVKVKYLDSDKCADSIVFGRKDLGFEVTSLSTFAQYTPQVNALEELLEVLKSYELLRGNKNLWLIIHKEISSKISETLEKSIINLE